MQPGEPHSPIWGRGLVLALMVAGVVGLVVALRLPVARPAPPPTVNLTATRPFDYSAWGRVLARFVNEWGMVDYAGLKRDPRDLDAFLAEVAKYSPRHDLAMFTTPEEGLAYWINAYNAWTMEAVVQAYPVASVMDIGGERGAVFDARTRLCGGEKMSLNQIEDLVRDPQPYGDARVHFALNCASMGCPMLPREPFLPDKLDAQLSAAARRFFSRRWYCRLGDGGREIEVSSILKWYRADFLRWMKRERKGDKIEDLLLLYAPQDLGAAVRRGARLEYMAYDWRLNDQGAAWGKSSRE